MRNIIKALAIVLHVLQAVQDTETNLAQEPGATKKAAVLQEVIAGAEVVIAGISGPATAAALASAVGLVIDGYVGIANLVGLFHKRIPSPIAHDLSPSEQP